MILLESIPQLAAFVTNTFLCFFVLKNRTGKTHIIYGAFSLCVAVWTFCAFMLFYDLPDPVALQCARVLHVGVLMIPAFFFHFITSLLHLKKSKKYVMPIYAVSSVFLILNFSGFLVVNVRKTDFGFYSIGNMGIYTAFSLFVTTVIASSLIMLLNFMRRAEGSRKSQLGYLAFGTGLSLLGGMNDFLPIIGIYEYPLVGGPVYPFGSLAIGIYGICVAYAIVRHQLMDIEVIIKRTAVFAGLFAFVYSTFTFITVLGRQYFEDKLGWNEWLALIPTVFIVTIVLRPLDNLLTNITERFLFQKKYDYRELLKTFTNEILTVLDMQKLMEQTIAGLVKIIKLESACVLLHDADNRSYKVVAGFGMREKDISISENDTLIRYLKAIHHPILKEKDVDRMHGDGHLKDDFKKLNAQLCLPISLHDDLVGVLALGMKKSGEDYTQEDVDILFTLARTEAIAISNARLFDELSKTQAEAAQREKMAVIGTLAAGINHEICNPLGIVRGHCEMFLLNSRDGFYDALPKEELLKLSTEIMNKVIRETDRATAITKKLSSFAKPSRKVDTEEVHIAKEVEEVLGLVAHDLKFSNIDVQIQFPHDFPSFRADRKQIQEVLFNIIRNAAQAIDKKEGRIVLSGLTENGSVFLKISDNGAGIVREKIGQIFSPFFTTKAPGQGTGLGLFIVKQIVERNKGTIQVESEPGIGTTFTLRFPLTQAELVHN
jgi:signal transduction histidine kinase